MFLEYVQFKSFHISALKICISVGNLYISRNKSLRSVWPIVRMRSFHACSYYSSERQSCFSLRVFLEYYNSSNSNFAHMVTEGPENSALSFLNWERKIILCSGTCRLRKEADVAKFLKIWKIKENVQPPPGTSGKNSFRYSLGYSRRLGETNKLLAVEVGSIIEPPHYGIWSRTRKLDIPE
jgi:hypothetical protein